MIWLIQKHFYCEDNFKKILYHLSIRNQNYYILEKDFDYNKDKLLIDIPNIENEEVFIFGGNDLSSLALKNNWNTFLTDCFNFDFYKKTYKHLLLNNDCTIIPLDDFDFKDEYYHIRPIKDDKLFQGKIFSLRQIELLKRKIIEPVVISSTKEIDHEIRCIIIDNELITSSYYRISGLLLTMETENEELKEFVDKIISLGLPSKSCVLDVGYSKNEYKIIEFNNFNASGFYNCNLEKVFNKLIK